MKIVNFQINGIALQCICRLLSERKSLLELSIESLDLERLPNLSELFITIQSNSTLQRLILKNANLGAKSVPYIQAMLCSNKTLLLLKLSGNNTRLVDIIPVLGCNKKLTTLELKHMVGSMTFRNKIIHNHDVEEKKFEDGAFLDIRNIQDNSNGERDSLGIVESLCHNYTLLNWSFSVGYEKTDLYIDSFIKWITLRNQIISASCSELRLINMYNKHTGFLLDFAKFFSLNFSNNQYYATCLNQVNSLYFRNCALTDSSQLFFTELVESSIQSITLSSCMLDNFSLRALVTFLDSNFQMKFLDLSHNNFSQCEDEIMNLLRRNSTLEILHLNYSSLPSTESFSYKISVALSENVTLKSLQLNGVGNIKFDYDLFTSSLKYNPTLTSITIPHASMDYFLPPIRIFFFTDYFVDGRYMWNIQRYPNAESTRVQIFSSNITNDDEFRAVQNLFTVERKLYSCVTFLL